MKKIHFLGLEEYRAQKAIAMAVDVILLALFLVSAVYGCQLSLKLLSLGQKSPALRLEIGYVYLAAPVGFTLASIRLIQTHVKKFQRKEV